MFEFNGGTSCVQTYVNQHEFFMSNLRVEEIDNVRESEDHADLSNPNLVPPEVDTSLVKLYDDIRITVRREAGIISSVFPQPATVMQVLLQRIFAQSVNSCIHYKLNIYLFIFIRYKIILKFYYPDPKSILIWRIFVH